MRIACTPHIHIHLTWDAASCSCCCCRSSMPSLNSADDEGLPTMSFHRLPREGLGEGAGCSLRRRDSSYGWLGSGLGLDLLH